MSDKRIPMYEQLLDRHRVREARLVAALTTIRDSMAGWVEGSVATMNPQEVHDFADVALTPPTNVGNGQQGTTS